MSLAIGEETTIEAILTSVKEELELTNTTTQDFYLRRLIKETERSIFSLDQTIQESAVLNIENNMAKLLSLIHISEPTRRHHVSRMPSSA